MALISRFTFVGDLFLPKKDSKRPFLREFEKTIEGTNKKCQMLSLNFGVKTDNTQIGYVECFGMTRDKIYVFDADNNKLEIDWEDRFDEIDNIPNYNRFVIDLGEDYGGRQEFLTEYDFIQSLASTLPDYDGRVVVSGTYTKDWYVDGQKWNDRFNIQRVYAAKPDVKNRLAVIAELFYSKDCVDKSEYDDEKKIYLNAYIDQYINKDEGHMLVPFQAVFSSAKYDMENEKHKKILKYKMKYIDVKGKKYYHIPWDMVLVNGAEEVEFDESMLTNAQKEQIELGLKTLNDFKPVGDIYGNRITEFRLFDPRLTGDFEDGLVEMEESASEIEEMIYIPPKNETEEEAKEKSKTKKKKPAKVEPEDDDEDMPFDLDDDEDELF